MNPNPLQEQKGYGRKVQGKANAACLAQRGMLARSSELLSTSAQCMRYFLGENDLSRDMIWGTGMAEPITGCKRPLCILQCFVSPQVFAFIKGLTSA